VVQGIRMITMKGNGQEDNQDISVVFRDIRGYLIYREVHV
jgi:hypothetical protein